MFESIMRSCIASDFPVLSETVLVLDGCLNCGDADRRSRPFAVTCRPMSRIATLDRFEYEYEMNQQQSGAPKSLSTSVSTLVESIMA
jgi:hypothetical protein